MIVNPGVENIEQRLNGEFDYLQAKYPTVAFNMMDWWGRPNDRSKGKNILLSQEGYITMPNNYNPQVINQYAVAFIPNRKVAELNPNSNINVFGVPLNWENYYELEDFLTYDQKVKGICSLQKVYNTGREGDINFMKDSVMKEFKTEPHLLLHTYGPNPYGKPESYKGNLGFRHGHYVNLKKINEYLFCWCPEPMYHPIWSYDYVTERLFNCFKSKTVAVYYGCYNSNDHIPKDFYVNYGDFKSIEELSDYLITLSNDKKRYTDMVEEAYKWNQTHKMGSIMEFEKLLQDVIKKYPL